MKATFAFFSLLAVFAAATETQQADVLPTVDGDLSGRTQDTTAKQPATLGGYNAQSAQLCEAGYPYYCNGYCCQLNRCCARSCCGPRATFCGADGYCYY